MEIDDVQAQQPSRKLPRFSDEDAAAGELNNSGGGGDNSRVVRSGWNPSSRIVRVSRASGGKDRHSKVLTSKGLRDRRIRLSVSTAIQFYDLQDRLGLDQPSKAVEWLIQAAAEAITDLPSIDAFPDERMASNGVDHDLGFGETQTQTLSKSACSSTSETSKNSSAALSLSRSEIRGKARERARERRTAKEKENENDAVQHHHQPPPTQSSFTQLLTGGFTNNNQDEPGPVCNNRHWTGPGSSSVEYFSPVQLIPPSSSSLPHFPPFTISGQEHHLHGQHLSFLQPESVIPTGDYGTLNFGISSSSSPATGISAAAGYSGRGTLQSNSSPSLFLNNNNNVQIRSSSSSCSSSSPMDSQSVSFFMATPPLDHHHHHQAPAAFDGRLYLYYGGGGENNKQGGKGRS